MTSKISIGEISELEVKRLLKDTKFSRLKPVACSRSAILGEERIGG
jgi:hypothetical protein